jgi:hypothetical protein
MIMTKKLSNSSEKNLNRAGRLPGVPNKSTTMAREAIARFVDGNTSRMAEWLEKVSEGVQATDKKGEPKYSPEGNPVYVVPPNPAKAFEMLQTVMEYHVPKLARTEVVGDKTAPQRMVISWKK